MGEHKPAGLSWVAMEEVDDELRPQLRMTRREEKRICEDGDRVETRLLWVVVGGMTGPAERLGVATQVAEQTGRHVGTRSSREQGRAGKCGSPAWGSECWAGIACARCVGAGEVEEALPKLAPVAPVSNPLVEVEECR